MPRRLKDTVHLLDPKSRKGIAFEAGSVPPDWTDGLIDPARFESEDAAETSGAGSSTAERPAKSANKDTWVDFAVSQGAERDVAETATKDDLIRDYGG